MRVLICGGRGFRLAARARAYLDALHAKTPITLVITGVDPQKPRGADAIGDAWAMDRGINCIAFPANWVGRGRPAGPIRDGMMLRIGRPDRVVAFPGGAGTNDMLDQAEAAGIPTHRLVATPPSDGGPDADPAHRPV